MEGKTVTVDVETKAQSEDYFRRAFMVIEDATVELRGQSARTAKHIAITLPLASHHQKGRALLKAHVQVAAFGLLPDIIGDLEAEANKLAAKWLNSHRVAISAMTDASNQLS